MIAGQGTGTRQTNDQPAETPDSPPSHEESRKSLYWGGWCPRLLASDLAAWPPSVATYLNTNYPILEQQTGVSVATNFIQGPLFNLLKLRVTNAIGTVPNLDTAQDPPLAVEGQSPASGLFSFDKYTSTNLTIEAARDAASVPDTQRSFFAVPNAHVTRIHTTAGAASSIDVIVNGALAVVTGAQQLCGDPGPRDDRIDAAGPGLVPHQSREPGRRVDGAKPDGALALQYLRPNQPRRVRPGQHPAAGGPNGCVTRARVNAAGKVPSPSHCVGGSSR